jgi:hypothetical protein
MSSTRNVIETFRDAVQDLLVPELKAVKISVDALRAEMKPRHDNLEKAIQHSDESNKQMIRNVSEKLDYAIDIRERLATIEARMPKQ